jgi:tyrosine-protein phosphatase SIW14
MPAFLRWTSAATVVFLVLVAPIIYYRWEYTHSKRLREVVPGRLYRSGQMTAPGFQEAVGRYHVRTIINLQDEYPDPKVDTGYFTTRSIRESELCRRLGVRYVYIPPDLVSRRRLPGERPHAIEQFLAVMDDPANYPVLIHCRAGLHRTGVMAAVYRMEYDGWDADEAINELKANGFGEWPCSAANDYIEEYILRYERGVRGAISGSSQKPRALSAQLLR